MTKSRNILAPRHAWTPTQEQALRAQYPDTPAATLAQSFGVSLHQVYAKARRMGLKKSEQFMEGEHSGRIQPGHDNPRMVATRFKPGNTSWNTGVHYTAGGRSSETRFKPGRQPHDAHNYLPIGSVRLNRDGYLEQKVTDDQSIAPARRWQFVHRLVWEAANGPIPSGHVVAFKKGMFTNQVELLSIDRLQCITRAENARLNSLWRSDPELMRLHQLKGAIIRQVNRIKESSNDKH